MSKLIVLFKKSNPLNCGNYRGIAINNIFFRLFDKILAKRLSLWYKPCVELAGSQEGRNCIEHMTLRLFVDYAKTSKLKLYIRFIDFEKAYDKIVRYKLIERLKSLGCGYRMLTNIIAIYKCTKFIFQKVTFIANLDVKQGSSTSSLLFILYVDKIIQMVTNSFNDDGFTGGVHILMLMDDTSLLSTSKACLIRKFKKCQELCKEYVMSIDGKKTKFMVINNDVSDKEDILSEGIKVKYCTSYIYIGAPITDDGKYTSVINLHADEKMKHVMKFYSFLNRNPEVPYPFKKKIAEACVLSTILYGSETWLNENFSKLENICHKIIKALLGVRAITCNDTCLFEAGMPSFKAFSPR